MLKINDYITSYISKDYGLHSPSFPIELDCSLGVNQENLPCSVFERFKQFSAENQAAIKQYPHDERIIEKIAAWYCCGGITWLTKEHLLLGNGSFDLLCNITLLSLAKNKKVLGHAPQFTAYIDHVNCLGADYCFYSLPPEKNYRFDAGEYLKKMNSGYDLFIIENPNNPTGQIIPLEQIKNIAQKARELNTVLVLDEAYGDYMEIENSAINLVRDFSNVIVTRSFSKGLGMAGIRLGYAVTQNDILAQLKKLVTPFNCNGIARVLACAMFDSFLNNKAIAINTNEIQTNKQKVLNALKKLYAAHTSLLTPIMTLYHKTDDIKFDLQHFLAQKVHLGTVGCAAYEGLDKRAVRLMLPKTADVENKLLLMLARAEQLLP
jgi:histidinol-phosphate aminotransferase